MPILNKGINSIPTIHIQDMVNIIERIIHRIPQDNYIFAVDRTKNRSLKNIIQSISTGCGNSKIISISSNEIGNYNKYPFEELGIDIHVKTSKVFDDVKDDDEEEEDFEKRKFQWHCEFGIPENSEKLRLEFTQYNDLKPVKLLITGPPGSGKTSIAEKLALFYNIPRIGVKDIIHYAKNLPENDDMIEEINTAIEEEKDKEVARLEEIESKKKNPKEINREEIKEHIPDEILNKVLRKLLKNNLYRNRGYILDNYPKTFNQAKIAFMEEDQEKAEDDPERIYVNKEILPNSLIKLDIQNDEVLFERFMIKKEDELINTHYNKADMERRIGSYRTNNESIYGEYSLNDFFKQKGLDDIILNGELEFDSLVSKAKLYIERVNLFSF